MILYSFEPVHFGNYPIRSDEKINIRENSYNLYSLDKLRSAEHGHPDEITRYSLDNPLKDKTNKEIKIANILLEKMFNPTKEYSTNKDGKLYTPTILKKIWAANDKEEYLVLPKPEQIDDILGIGFRLVDNERINSLMGISREEIMSCCGDYWNKNNWEFQIILRESINKNRESREVVRVWPNSFELSLDFRK